MWNAPICVYIECKVYFESCWLVWNGFMVFKATFNNISIISWRSFLLVEETGGPEENHRPAASHWQTLSHIMLYTSPWAGFELRTSVVIGTDCIGSCKSNYHTITATTAPGIILTCLDKYYKRHQHANHYTPMRACQPLHPRCEHTNHYTSDASVLTMTPAMRAC